MCILAAEHLLDSCVHTTLFYISPLGVAFFRASILLVINVHTHLDINVLSLGLQCPVVLPMRDGVVSVESQLSEQQRTTNMATTRTAMANRDNKVVPLFAPQDKKESEKKWGKAVMGHGYCIFPSILLQAQGRLGVSAQEMVVLLQLAEHWWKAASKVYPSKDVIAQRVGLSAKQVQRHIRRLEELKLVQRKERYRSGGSRTTNEYDLSGLVAKLKAIEPDVAKAKKLKAAATQAGGVGGVAETHGNGTT